MSSILHSFMHMDDPSSWNAFPSQEETEGIVKYLISPLTSKFTRRGGRLWDLVPRESVGQPQYFVSHAWGAKLVDVVDQLVRCVVTGKVCHVLRGT